MGATASIEETSEKKKMLFYGKETKVEYENEKVKKKFLEQVWPNLEEDNEIDSSQKFKELCEKKDLIIHLDECENVRIMHVSEAKNCSSGTKAKESKREEVSDEELETVIQLLRNHEESWTLEKKKQVIVCFVDGSERSHHAYETAKKLVKLDGSDELSVVTVESEKKYLQSNYKVNEIKTKYETDLTGYLPSKRWHFLSLPKNGKATKDIVKDFVNNRAASTLPIEAKTHPDPTFVVVGFSGRKSSQDRDPTVIGQVADLSLRTIFCPCILVKGNAPAKSTHRHFLMLIDETQRCLTALKILSQLLHTSDTLSLLHTINKNASTQVSDLDTIKHKIETLYAPFASRSSAIHYLEAKNPKNIHESIIQEINDSPNFNDIDFVCLASRPRKFLGSISDNLVRSCLSSVILIKTPPTI